MPLKKIIIFILIVLLVVLAFYAYKNFSKQPEPLPPAQEAVSTIPARPSSFADGADHFLKNVKLARIELIKGNTNKGEGYIRDAFILWRDVVNEYINNPVAEYEGGDAWAQNIASIYESIQAAYEFIKKTETEASAQKLDESRQFLNNIYATTNNNIESQLFSILLSAEKVSKSATLDEVKDNLSLLKLEYTGLKSLAQNSNQAVFGNFERVLSDLDNATNATLGRSQAELLPAFASIYEIY